MRGCGTGDADAPGSRRAEGFRPPRARADRKPRGALRVRLRALADLQFGSIWRDLERLLAAGGGDARGRGRGRAAVSRSGAARSALHRGGHRGERNARFGYRTPDTRYFSRQRAAARRRARRTPCSAPRRSSTCATPRHFLRELRRVLAPGGRLILTVPFAARWHFVPQDYWRFTPSGLAHTAERRRDFAKVRMYARGGALAVACYKMLGFILLMLAGSGRRGAAALPARLAGSGCRSPRSPPRRPRRAGVSGNRGGHARATRLPGARPRRIRWDTRSSRSLTGRAPAPSAATPTIRTSASRADRSRRLGALSYASRKEPEYMNLRMVVCPRCELLYAPRVPESSGARPGLCRHRATTAPRRREFAAASYAQALRRTARRTAGSRGALDIGAGNGALLEHLGALGFAEVVGVEPSIGRRRTRRPRRFGRMIRVERFDPEQPAAGSAAGPFLAGHRQSDARARRGAVRAARARHGGCSSPGGALMIVSHDYRHPLMRLLGRHSPIIDIGHLQLFSRSSLGFALTARGIRRRRHRAVRQPVPAALLDAAAADSAGDQAARCMRGCAGVARLAS